MPNTRILYDNAARRVSAISATSSASASVAVGNLLDDVKSHVWRSATLTESITLNFSVAEPLSVVLVLFAKLTSTATMRVRCYEEPGDVDAVLDTGIQLCCAYAPLGSFEWGIDPLGVNSYSRSENSYARVYFSIVRAKQVRIDLQDLDNQNGYIQAGCLALGSYLEFTYPLAHDEYSIGFEDSSQRRRNDAGDLRTRLGFVYRRIPLNLNRITRGPERARVYEILSGNGSHQPVFLSIYPEHSDPLLEQSAQIYGKCTSTPALSNPSFGIHSVPIEIEEI